MKRVSICISRHGMTILYRCFDVPGYGRKCVDKYTDKCYRCRYCKAEMSADDATTLLNAYGRKQC